MSKDPNTMTMWEHATAYYAEKGDVLPPYETEQGRTMYEAWVTWAFDFDAPEAK